MQATGDGGTRHYAYDAAGQLVGASGPDGSWTWEYDACGRLMTETGPAGTRRLHYDAADQLLAIDGPAGTTRFAYDPMGRRVAEEGPDGTVRYEWDSVDRLVAIERAEGGERRRVDLRHDPLGRPVRVGQQDLRWELGGVLGPVPDTIGGRDVVMLPGVPLAEVDGAGVRWLSADWRGSVGTRSTWGARPEPAGAGGAELGFLGGRG